MYNSNCLGFQLRGVFVARQSNTLWQTCHRYSRAIAPAVSLDNSQSSGGSSVLNEVRMSTILDGYSPRKLSQLKTKFWRYVHPDGRDHDLPVDECWEWQGARFADGGPAYGTRNRVYAARYVAYALEVEDVPEGHYVTMTCDNQLCVNPAHLRLAVWRPENDATSEDKVSAGYAVHRAVWSSGVLPQVSSQKCVKCGSQAAHYHHYLGYAPEHWLDVEPLCNRCHYQSELKIIRESGPVYHFSS